ncbi:MAG: type IV pilus secretin PilQ [Pseudomonadota bacterium]
MRSNILLLMLVLTAGTGRAAVSDSPVTLDFEEAPVTRIFYYLAGFRDLNLVIAPGVTGTLSLRLHDIAWPRAISLVSEMAGVRTVLDENILRVFPEGQREDDAGRRNTGNRSSSPVITRRFTLRNTDVASIKPLLMSDRAGLLSASGRISANSRANMLIVQDTAESVRKISEWLDSYDVAIPQVEITAHIITISEESLRELGVDWGYQGERLQTDPGTLSVLNIPLSVTPASFTAGMTLTRINGQLLSLELSALEQEHQAEIIASPRLITSHGNMASIKQGTEIPYVVTQGKNETATVEFKEAVLGMQITPEVLGEGNVRLTIQLSQNVPGKALQKGSNVPISIDKQEISTRVTVRDGQTLALGGIFQQNQNNQRNKVPLLGEIPFFGQLFRHDAHQQNKRELVIFITPRLIFP